MATNKSLSNRVIEGRDFTPPTRTHVALCGAGQGRVSRKKVVGGATDLCVRPHMRDVIKQKSSSGMRNRQITESRKRHLGQIASGKASRPVRTQAGLAPMVKEMTVSEAEAELRKDLGL